MPTSVEPQEYTRNFDMGGCSSIEGREARLSFGSGRVRGSCLGGRSKPAAGVAWRSAPMTVLAKSPAPNTSALGARFLSFVVEQHPFALAAARTAWTKGNGEPAAVKHALLVELEALLAGAAADLPEPTPFVPAARRVEEELARLADAVDAFFERASIAATVSPEEKRWLLRGVILTRAVDSRVKQRCFCAERKYGEVGFRGKGF